MALAPTRYTVNENLLTAFSALNGGLLALVVDYRGLVHPTTGLPMRPDIAADVENDLQRTILSRRRSSTRALKIAPARYLLAEPFGDRTAAGTRFVSYVRGFKRMMLTPNSSGFHRGVPFWGSCSAISISAPALRAAANELDAAGLAGVLARSNRPDFHNTFYGSPASTATNIANLPLASGGATVAGAYPGSIRRLASGATANATGAERPGQLTLGLEGLQQRVVIDDWGPWSEIVPFPTSTLLGPISTEADFGIPLDVRRDIEPLIAELWREYGQSSVEVGEGFRLQAEQHFSELHGALISLSDAVRANKPSLLSNSLGLLGTIVLALSTNLVASYLWQEYGEQIAALIERLK